VIRCQIEAHIEGEVLSHVAGPNGLQARKSSLSRRTAVRANSVAESFHNPTQEINHRRYFKQKPYIA